MRTLIFPGWSAEQKVEEQTPGESCRTEASQESASPRARGKMRRRKSWLLIAAAGFVFGCGVKGPPRPPEQLLPPKPHKAQVRVRAGCVELQWRPGKLEEGGTSAEHWEVWRAAAPEEGAEPVYRLLTGVKVPRASDCTLAPGEGAWYVMRGIAGSGERGPMTEPLKVINYPTPAAPANLTVSAGDGFVDLSWTPSPVPGLPESERGGVEIGFNVYRAQARDDFPWRPLNSSPLPRLAYTDLGLENGVRYYYEVRTVIRREGAAEVESAPAGPVSVIPRDLIPPLPPEGLAAVSGPEGVTLRWFRNPEPDVQGYVISRRERGEGKFQPLFTSPIAETTYLDRTAQPGREYEYRVQAVDRAEPPNVSGPSEIQVVYIVP